MPVSVKVRTGDGVKSVLVDAVLVLPDSGSSLALAGVVQAPGQSAQAITGSPLTIPSNPVSGNIFWQVVVNWLTGAASIVQSTVSDPSPVAQGPCNPLLLLGQQMPALANVPTGGRSTNPQDASVSVPIFKQTLTSTSPSAAWQNTSSTIPDNF